MNHALEWLLDLRTLRFGQEGVEFSFARPLPPWGWALVVLAAAGLAWWSYRRLEGSGRWRGALATVRALVLVLLAVLLAGPRLVKANETEEKDWVLVLADRSASMGIRDVGTGAPGSRTTREEELRRALEASAPMWREMARDRIVVWMGFDAGAFELKSSPTPPAAGAPPGLPVELAEPTGRRTAIGRALEQAMRRAAARPVAGVVLLSDGRSSDEPGKALLRRLQAERVPVFTVALGSAEAVADVAVRAVQGPRVAFVNDLVPIEAEIERVGAEPTGTKWGKVQLVETSTGLVLDERDVGANARAATAPGDQPTTAGAARDQVERVILTARPGTAGSGKWVVRVVPSGTDLVAENNQAEVDLKLEDRPLRVLYLDGYPRWEYRFLKNLLVREHSVTAAALLLAEGRRFVQEGDQPLLALPNSPEEWRAFDVIVIGDVRPEMFTEEQLAQLRDHVGIDGAGVLWIGGESSTPGAWASTGLSDLLPFSLRGATARGSGVETWSEPVLVRPAPAAERYGVLRLTETQEAGAEGALAWWPRELGDATLGWPRLRWAQRIDAASLKPTTEVLADAVAESEPGPLSPPGATPRSGGKGSTPLVMSMRFGNGRVVYVGTDETWRWRFGRGEDLQERFWLQMVRMLGRESLARSGLAARAEVTPTRAEVNQPVRIAVELLDEKLAESGASTVTARLIRLGDRGGENVPVADLALSPEGAGGGGSGTGANRRSAGSKVYATLWVPTESGKYRLEVNDPLLGGERLGADLEVWLPEDELRRPETDHPLLAKLSEATGGNVLGVGDLNQLAKLLPNRRVRLVGTPEEEALWDKPVALILLVVLLTVEWVGRRLLRLA